MGIKLRDLASQLQLKVMGDGNPEINAITEDSRQSGPDILFTAIEGERHNGRDFIQEAIDRKSPAVLLAKPDIPNAGLRLLAPDEFKIRDVMAKAANIIYDKPADKLLTLALTGTNGKTTTAYLLESILENAGLTPGVMGTVEFRWPGTKIEAINTTPEGSVLYKHLKSMFDAGCKSAVMEISSHALALGRLGDQAFDIALFNNLSRDHLDYHKDMENYYQAKKLLFTKHLKNNRDIHAVINYDNFFGQRLYRELKDNLLSFSFEESADVKASIINSDKTGLVVDINSPFGHWRQKSPLLGAINAYNLVAAASMALAAGLDIELIRSSLEIAQTPPGRMEIVGKNPNYLVVVDYAHTPLAISELLLSAKKIATKRIFILFGCGGGRDKGKRPMMAKVAADYSDCIILTSDNPRYENPLEIISHAEVALKESGLTGYSRASDLIAAKSKKVYLKEPDRKVAIETAISLLEEGDMLLIAGKGHENFQIIGGEKIPFNDYDIAKKALQNEGKY